MKIIFHVPQDFASQASASSVRPYQIYNAFLSLGYDVFLLSGNVKDRKYRFEQLKKEDIKTFDFCYSEPSTYPVHPILDYQIYSFMNRNSVPLGIFYRDAYWMFEDYFIHKRTKKVMLKIRYLLDIVIMKRFFRVFFFPSESFKNFFCSKIKIKQKTAVLPPGCNKQFNYIDKEIDEKLESIYVGGISERYGIKLLLESFFQLNRDSCYSVVLNLVCRENEFKQNKQILNQYIKYDWLVIHHLRESELEKVYRRSSFAVIPLLRDGYNDMAMPVKLFEYIGWGLPIVATDCTEQAKFVRENNIGFVCNDNVPSMVEALRYILHDSNLYKFKNNLKKTIESHSWENRARKIVQELQ